MYIHRLTGSRLELKTCRDVASSFYVIDGYGNRKKKTIPPLRGESDLVVVCLNSNVVEDDNMGVRDIGGDS